MKKNEDDSFRPESYWKHSDPLSEILSGISGTARREMIRDYWERGELSEIEDVLLSDEITADQRNRLSQIHPFFMGGEYLPNKIAGETTIVRIDLESTTHDVIELRASRLPNSHMKLRWVDEYETEFILKDQSETIKKPFTFGELKSFIKGTYHIDLSDPFPLMYNVSNCINGSATEAENLRYFTRYSSEFYPQIAGWVEQVVDEWIQEKYSNES